MTKSCGCTMYMLLKTDLAGIHPFIYDTQSTKLPYKSQSAAMETVMAGIRHHIRHIDEAKWHTTTSQGCSPGALVKP